MASLKEKIKEDADHALKSGDKFIVSVLRFFLATLQSKEMALPQNKQFSDPEIIDLLFSEIKKRKEASLEFRKGSREDLAKKEEEEIKILQKYLPEQASIDEVKKIVEEALKKTGAKSVKDIGKVMAEVLPKLKGRAEGGLISEMIRSGLG
jgi:uncharacterized protein